MLCVLSVPSSYVVCSVCPTIICCVFCLSQHRSWRYHRTGRSLLRAYQNELQVSAQHLKFQVHINKKYWHYFDKAFELCRSTFGTDSTLFLLFTFTFKGIRPNIIDAVMKKVLYLLDFESLMHAAA